MPFYWLFKKLFVTIFLVLILVLEIKESYGSFIFALCCICLAYPLFVIIRKFWRTYKKEASEQTNMSAPHLIIDPNKRKYEKNADIAAGICLVSLFALISLTTAKNVDGNIWNGNNPLAVIGFLSYGISLLVALWYYGESKGYNGFCCAPLFFLSVFGLGILLALENKTKYPLRDKVKVLPGGRS